MAPEAQVKRAVGILLRSYGEDVYYHMPVPGGFGGSALDYIGVCRGMAFSIETKRKGARPTARQKGIIEAIEKAGGKVFVIDGPAGVAELDTWLSTLVHGA